jgi:hypothetical protein
MKIPLITTDKEFIFQFCNVLYAGLEPNIFWKSG